MLENPNTDELRTKINLAELNRDDKAHRFVVTWNAFNDGNRLAIAPEAKRVAHVVPARQIMNVRQRRRDLAVVMLDALFPPHAEITEGLYGKSEPLFKSLKPRKASGRTSEQALEEMIEVAAGWLRRLP